MMPSFFIFMWFLIVSIMMALSSSSLFFLWICLEINMMSFIPLMYTKNMITMNSIILYFLIQSTASSIFIFMISTFFYNKIITEYLMTFITLTMLIKVGAAPFHIWFPQISEGLTFNSLSILLTIQKIIPLYIMSIFKTNMIMISVIMSAFIGSFGGFNQFSLRKILAFSSISHLSWILTLLLINSNFWLIYLSIYSLIIFTMIYIINQIKMNMFNFSKKINPELNLTLIMMLLTLGGMPPTIGFFMKWMALNIIFNQIMMVTIPLIMSSLINTFFYLRLSYPSMLKNIISYKWEKPYFYKWIPITFIQITAIFMMITMI
uniref:NADH dehydrogenase subunit 2 n=1 Tax=Alectorobius mimon TaxID=360319 RepID=UPI0022381759|nr:NADH dehydrogenase subunit 2 [Alectorobius mimon]UYB78444.1 NADH dehydrogenase subunit 2 [Alectorobius mimon]UYB78457.1 NADH dehydrogenase subunit 2 [Alectorobius mimon]